MSPGAMSDWLGAAGLVGALFLIVLLILWFLLPLAVFGIKKRLDTSGDVMKAILNRLDSIDASLKRQAQSPSPADDTADTRREPQLRPER